MTWRTAHSLGVVLDEINAHAPRRSKISDGSVSSDVHKKQNPDSDHDPDAAGVVRARDFTHDPAGGLDCNDLAELLAAMLRLGRHPALGSGAYVIWNGRIISRARIGEGWRRYTGSNPHTKHLHLSVATAPSGYDSSMAWNLWPAKEPIVAKLQRPFFVRRALRSAEKAVARIDKQLATNPGAVQTQRLADARALVMAGCATLKEIKKQ